MIVEDSARRVDTEGGCQHIGRDRIAAGGLFEFAHALVRKRDRSRVDRCQVESESLRDPGQRHRTTRLADDGPDLPGNHVRAGRSSG